MIKAHQAFKLKSKFRLLFLAISLFLILLNPRLPYDTAELTPADKAIGAVGYLLSRVFVYKPQDTELSNSDNPAMLPNSVLRGETKIGELMIKSGRGRLRRIFYQGVQNSIEVKSGMISPTQPGLFFAADDFWPGYCWPSKNGISKCTFLEGTINFNNLSEAMAWLIENEKFSSFTFIQGGFFLRANRNLDSLDVQLYRLEIAGIPLEEKEVRQEVKSGEHDIFDC
ncbi:MAG: hypothetical protein SFY67_00695 [Candidatus Melainabacteria bacterium]|nr:hypothetical protein [Candidatus Melainabacteria bacterium]